MIEQLKPFLDIVQVLIIPMAWYIVSMDRRLARIEGKCNGCKDND